MEDGSTWQSNCNKTIVGYWRDTLNNESGCAHGELIGKVNDIFGDQLNETNSKQIETKDKEMIDSTKK